MRLSYNKAIEMIVERWHEIQDRLKGIPIKHYPFTESIIKIGRGKKSDHVPTIRSVNKVLSFMDWGYVKSNYLNQNLPQENIDLICFICENYDKVNWDKESDYICNFFKHSKSVAHPSDTYHAPAMKSLKRIEKIINNYDTV